MDSRSRGDAGCSVEEAGENMGPGRREIGRGCVAGRGLAWPATRVCIRVRRRGDAVRCQYLLVARGRTAERLGGGEQRGRAGLAAGDGLGGGADFEGVLM